MKFIFPFIPGLPSKFFPLKFPNYNFVFISHVPHEYYIPNHIILHHLISLTILREVYKQWSLSQSSGQHLCSIFRWSWVQNWRLATLTEVFSVVFLSLTRSRLRWYLAYPFCLINHKSLFIIWHYVVCNTDSISLNNTQSINLFIIEFFLSHVLLP